MDEKKMTAAVRRGTLQASAICVGASLAVMGVAYGICYAVTGSIPETTVKVSKTEEKKSE